LHRLGGALKQNGHLLNPNPNPLSEPSPNNPAPAEDAAAAGAHPQADWLVDDHHRGVGGDERGAGLAP
jgi:hypothetical protein